MIENRMTVDNQLKLTEGFIEEETVALKQSGYCNIFSREFVHESEAYEYALQHSLYGSDEEQKEFKDMLVEWFYSGNWIKDEK